VAQLDLDALYLRARSAWPGVELAKPHFEAFARPRLPEGEASAEIAAELYLACACVRGDAVAMRCFEERYFGEVASAVRRFDAELVDDVKQGLRERLFLGVNGGRPKLEAFSGQSGLARWLRAVATRLALNLRRWGRREDATPFEEDDLLGSPLGAEDPQLAHMKSLYRGEFKRAFADSMAGLEAEAQNYLRLYYLDGLGLAEIAGVFGSSAPTVSRRLSRARADVLAATRQHLMTRLKISPEELESIMRLIQSRLTPGPVLDEAQES
jgi:RNA polymerase sigma-70 factor (ECF subfamily)